MKNMINSLFFLYFSICFFSNVTLNSSSKSKLSFVSNESRQNQFKQLNTNLVQINSQGMSSSSSTTASMTNSKLKQSPSSQSSSSTNSTSSTIDALKQFSVTSCNTQNCPAIVGTCTSTTSCQCNDGFLNFPTVTSTGAIGSNCSYPQKKQITAFLLEFFIMGAGHMYRGSLILGILKLLFVILFPYMLCCLCFMGILTEASIKAQSGLFITGIILAGMYVLGVLVWFFYDIVNYGLNSYMDQNGIPLKPW